MPRKIQLGDVFERMVMSLGFEKTSGCPCTDTKNLLTTFGPTRVIKSIDYFVKQFELELQRRSLNVPRPLIEATILIACHITENPESFSAKVLDFAYAVRSYWRPAQPQ
jgi:hypothetical protein